MDPPVWRFMQLSKSQVEARSGGHGQTRIKVNPQTWLMDCLCMWRRKSKSEDSGYGEDEHVDGTDMIEPRILLNGSSFRAFEAFKKSC